MIECYNKQAVKRAEESTATRERLWKKFEKTFKKGLTNGKRCDIISKLSRRRRLPKGSEAIRKGRSVIENWTTMREVQSIEVCARTDLGNSLENTTQTKSKRAIKLERKILSAERHFIYHFSRVWSWLRMNAGGVHNTFKSNGVTFINPSGSVDIT